MKWVDESESVPSRKVQIGIVPGFQYAAASLAFGGVAMRILALVPSAASVAACLDTAEAAASGLPDVSIEVLHVVVDPATLVTSAEEVALQLWRQLREGSASDRLQAARAATTEWLRTHPDAPVAPNWKEIAGSEFDAICAEASAFDILVVPRATNLDGIDALQAAFQCTHRPFFLAPHGWITQKNRPLADRVVVAWNGTPACRHAIDAARPWLRISAHPILMTISADATSGEDLAAELRVAGIIVATRHLLRDSEALGDQIVTEAKAAGATLLVMGAHRHGGWIEWLLGHTTDQAIRHEDITFLMAH